MNNVISQLPKSNLGYFNINCFVNLPKSNLSYINSSGFANLPKSNISYINSNTVSHLPYIFIAYNTPVLPSVSIPKVEVSKHLLTLSSKLLKFGTGEISKCGFLIGDKLEGAELRNYKEYNCRFIPSQIEEPFIVNVVGLPSGINYIAAFAENDAGRAVSECIAYENKGYLLAESFAKIMVGDVVIELCNKSKTTNESAPEDNSKDKPEDSSKGIYLDGVNNYIMLPKEVLGGKQVFTVELKLSTTDNHSSNIIWDSPCLCGFVTYGDDTGDFNIGINSGNLVCFAGLGYEDSIVTKDKINDGMVYSISLVCDGEKATLYKNNIPYSTTCKVRRNLGNDSIHIGIALPQVERKATLTLYEARFWDVARKLGELGNKIAGNESGLRAWYRCLETSGDVLKDSSNNKFDGKIVGNVWGS